MFINYSCIFEIFLSNGNLARRIFRTLWFMAKRNFLLCSIWLPLVSVFQVSQLKPLLTMFMSHYRRLMNTEAAAVLRHDALLLSPLPRPRVRHSRYQHPPSLVPGQEIQIRTRYTPPGHPAALPRLHADCRAPGTLRPDHVASLHHSRQRDTGREVATEVCV